jgi:PEP-CTERM motif
MKIRLSGIAAAAALAISTLVAASAQAAVFDFSYAFGDGSLATGVVEGTVQPDGNTIDIYTVDSFTANGQSIDPAVAISAVHHTQPAIATFDGSFMDFYIANPTLNYGLSLYSPTQFAEILPPGGPADFETYDPTHWSITAAQAVPEPATWAMMGLGFAGIGALAYRARRKATVAA